MLLKLPTSLKLKVADETFVMAVLGGYELISGLATSTKKD